MDGENVLSDVIDKKRTDFTTAHLSSSNLRQGDTVAFWNPSCGAFAERKKQVKRWLSLEDTPDAVG